MTWIAPGAVAQGTVVTPPLGPTRTAEDLGAPRARTVASDADATRWHFVVANLTMHQSDSLGRLVAEHEALPEDLGPKGTCGRRQSMATRAAFLADPRHRMVCHDTPNHASWMQQIAMWCSMLVRKLRKRASCTSVEDLHTRLLAFVDYFNATMAKPFKWTYGKKPLYVQYLRQNALT